MLSDTVIKIRFWISQAILLLIYPIVLLAAIGCVIYKSFFKTRKSVAGEVALVTGSAQGLGKEIAAGLAARGCHIAIVDINKEAAENTVQELIGTYKIKAKSFLVNVTKFDEIEKLAKDVEASLGPVTILVNNAGLMTFSRFNKPPPEDIQGMISTNLTAHIWTIRVFLDKMRELGKGHIVAVSSIAGFFPCHRQLEYTATKFGVRGLMMALRTELFALNCEFIKTTTAYPFFLKTNARVENLSKMSGALDYYPSISGAEAAEAIVEGIVANETEIVIPQICAFSYRLLELLPKDWSMKILNFACSREMLKNVEYDYSNTNNAVN